MDPIVLIYEIISLFTISFAPLRRIDLHIIVRSVNGKYEIAT